jgi:hypothetical protein
MVARTGNIKVVIRGLDPRIHRLRKNSGEATGGLGKSPCKPAPRSGNAWLRRLLLSRFRADRLSPLCRLDAERPACGGRRGRGLGIGPEIRPAAWTELRSFPDHAGRDAVDIRNEFAAQLHRIAAAGLLLLGGIGLACRGPQRNRERNRQHQAERKIRKSDGRHESPRSVALRIVGEWQGIGK